MANYARIELHLHLDGSLSVRWAYEKALQRKIIEKSCSFRDFYNMVFRDNTQPHSVSINKFDLMCDLLQTPEDLSEAAYDLSRRLYSLGIWYAEIRFASQQHMKKGLKQKEALLAVISGTKKAMKEVPITVQVIDCMMHKGSSALFNEAQNVETIEAVRDLRKDGACGIDLAGYENNCDFSEYASLFQYAKSLGIPCTVHAGEMGIGSHVIDALNWGVDRIGHGVNCIQKTEYLERVVSSRIPLELCVTSNVKRDMNYGNHAVLSLMEAGAVVTLNSDNMMFARTCCANEHFQMKMLGVTDQTLKQCAMNAVQAAFCDEDTKNRLKEKIEKEEQA